MINLLKGTVNTLNGIEVKGEENLDRLLGSIRALKTVITAMESKSQVPVEEGEQNG